MGVHINLHRGIDMSEVAKTYDEGWHDESKVCKMKYTQLGQTDMIVSQVAIGGSVIGGCYPNEATIKEMSQTVITALKSGLNWIDTSPYYGNSETILGSILAEVPRNVYYLATKVGRSENGFDFSAEAVTKQFHSSLDKLGVQYVDLIQVHDFESCSDPSQILHETFAALDLIRLSGKARYIGITGYPLSEFKEVLDNTSIRVDTVLSYARNIFTDSSLQDHIEYFIKKGVGIISGSPTGMGLLTNAGPPDWHPATDNLKNFCREAGKYCKDRGVELGKLSVFHCLQFEGIHTTVLGFGSMDILNINLDIILNGLSEEELEVYHQIVEKFFKDKKEHWEGMEKRRLSLC